MEIKKFMWHFCEIKKIKKKLLKQKDKIRVKIMS
jgi:hypothetical protein